MAVSDFDWPNNQIRLGVKFLPNEHTWFIYMNTECN